jgi:hypothetical protein
LILARTSRSLNAALLFSPCILASREKESFDARDFHRVEDEDNWTAEVWKLYRVAMPAGGPELQTRAPRRLQRDRTVLVPGDVSCDSIQVLENEVEMRSSHVEKYKSYTARLQGYGLTGMLLYSSQSSMAAGYVTGTNFRAATCSSL